MVNVYGVPRTSQRPFMHCCRKAVLYSVPAVKRFDRSFSALLRRYSMTGMGCANTHLRR